MRLTNQVIEEESKHERAARSFCAIEGNRRVTETPDNKSCNRACLPMPINPKRHIIFCKKF
jgi:hypothetical protein